ncbi:Protein kinase domain-containing protein [Selenomonas ruminantium]|uniref:Protein kinase domain-containing protein n=1 Tax=Selenomonas ruminantium TaxID=971 RepID=A0A1M6X3M6_SELRU|nr:protein kinase [Selenomonas ruminantium]SHL00395.1 Protein kinase domain-containing protein [Selenomonas ruminantium]
MLKENEDYRFNNGKASFCIKQKWIDFIIPKYHLINVIGVGANGVVFRAHEKFTDRDVVIKAWVPRSKDLKRYRDQFFEEIRKISKMSHPNIVTIYDANIYRDKICWAVYNYIEGISLEEWLNNHPSEIQRISIAKDIFKTVLFYQKMGILHGDLHNRNILVGKNDEICIIDFGTSKFGKKKKTLNREICLMLELVDDLLSCFSVYSKKHFLLNVNYSNQMEYKVDKHLEKYFTISPCCLSSSIIYYINILEMLTYCVHYSSEDFVDYCKWLYNASYLNIYKLIEIYVKQDTESGCTQNIEAVIREGIGEDIFLDYDVDAERNEHLSRVMNIAIAELAGLLNTNPSRIVEDCRKNLWEKYIITTRIREILSEEDDNNRWLFQMDEV